MASNPYVKSLLWLVSLGGIGYFLLKVTEPSKSKIQEIRSKSSAYLSEDEKKKILFLKKLKAAADEPPIYLQRKEK